MLSSSSAMLRALPTSRSVGLAAASRRYASGGQSYNAPSGYLFGERPVKGQKRQRESWETIYYLGMFGGMGLATVLLIYKPDTSIQTWALEEAKKRMEARGDTPKYKPSS